MSDTSVLFTVVFAAMFTSLTCAHSRSLSSDDGDVMSLRSVGSYMRSALCIVCLSKLCLMYVK